MSSKKPQFKTVLVSPYPFQWSVLTSDIRDEIIATLKESIGSLKLSRPKRPYMSRDKQGRQLVKDNQTCLTSEEINIRSQLLLGLNEVTRKLEKGQVRLALVTLDDHCHTNLSSHLIPLAASTGCPIAAVRDLSRDISPILNIRSLAALGFTKRASADSPAFDKLITAIAEKIPPLLDGSNLGTDFSAQKKVIYDNGVEEKKAKISREVATSTVDVLPTIDISSTVDNVLPTVDTVLTTVDTVLPTVDNVLPTVDSISSTTSDVLPSVDSISSTISDVLPIVDSISSTISDVLPIVDSISSTISDVLPTVDTILPTIYDDFTRLLIPITSCRCLVHQADSGEYVQLTETLKEVVNDFTEMTSYQEGKSTVATVEKVSQKRELFLRTTLKRVHSKPSNKKRKLKET